MHALARDGINRRTRLDERQTEHQDSEPANLHTDSVSRVIPLASRIDKPRPRLDYAPMHLPPVAHRSVFITGCSTGIGRATAHLLHQRNWRVFAGARKAADLESLGAEGFTPVKIDVTDSAEIKAALASILENTGGTLGALVNNAGFGQPGAMEDLSRDALRYQFEVNVFGLQELTNLVLPAMLRAGAGRIVHISSVLGKVATPLMGAYCASKHAVEAMADAQRVELRGTGIGLSVVEPGPIRSEFRNTSARTGLATLQTHTRIAMPDLTRPRDATGPFALGPEAVARAIVHALESPRPRRRYRITVHANLAPLLRALLPDAVYDWAVHLRANSRRAR